MDIDDRQLPDDDQLRGLDRAQLMKLGAAALLAAIAGGAAEGEADAAVHAMVPHTVLPIGLDYQTHNYGKNALVQRTRARMGAELKRVRVTSNRSQTAGATIVHTIDDAEIVGTDESGHAHNRRFGSSPMYVALWME
jgi:hypothetical protein